MRHSIRLWALRADTVCFPIADTTFHKASVRMDRISKIKITRNPFQRMNGTCHLYVYTSAEGSSRHVVRGLNYERLTVAMAKAGIIDP